MIPGLYETVIDRALVELLQKLDPKGVIREKLDTGDSHMVLAEHVANILRKALASAPKKETLQAQLRLCNKIVSLLHEEAPHVVDSGQAIDDDLHQLTEILSSQRLVSPRPSPRPGTPLGIGCLLTGTRADPSLVNEFKLEISTANTIDILCAFIRWTGIRTLEDELEEFANREGSRLRIITTSYMGNTDIKAIDFLARLPNTQIAVSYNTARTRLHAKAYMFGRSTRFGPAYIGSSNISGAALTDGLEWNVKVSQYESPHIWEKIVGTFDTYWNDSEFELYEGGQRRRLIAALKHEQAGPNEFAPFYFKIQPYQYQEQILSVLAAERLVHGRYRNLLVAATGTGKTLIAAFDFKRFADQLGRGYKGTRLLFVAHRKEILEQSISCFRMVLGDRNFGELLVGEYEPDGVDQLFVSIQSYNSRGLSARLVPEYYDYVVIDEIHHAPAQSYHQLLNHLKPQILLGLTATPERHDGKSVLRYFGDRISYDLRLPDAINAKLLSPFQYFVISDTVDLSQLKWVNGGYQTGELDRVYIGNVERTRLIIEAVSDKVLDTSTARAIGFCSSKLHAEYMARAFNDAGIKSEALTSDSNDVLRTRIKSMLSDRSINFVFVVDIYNEGVDLPDIDTVLFLRPTESLTIFLQQLGRGLRLSSDKECLTVLDFVGHAHRNYDFSSRFRALLDGPGWSVEREIQNGFPHVPSGCVVSLERRAQQQILNHIRASFRGANAMAAKIRQYIDDRGHIPGLADFLRYHELDIRDVYSKDSWVNLLVLAGAIEQPKDADNNILSGGLRRVCHANSPANIQRWLRLLESTNGPIDQMDEFSATMLHVSLWGEWEGSTREGLRRLRDNPNFRNELIELLQYRFEKVSFVPPATQLPFETPLEIHAQYTRDEVLAGLGYWTTTSRPAMREGVRYLAHIKTDVLFVTLNKTEQHYSPTTMYDDYAITDALFHWQSQSNTSVTSKTAARYLNHIEMGTNVLLFVRENTNRDGRSEPFHFLGPVVYESHSGSKPVSIIWRMVNPIPARILATARRLADA